MAAECYALVHGSAIRVTELDKRGRFGDEIIAYGVSSSVARVSINEVTDPGSREVVATDLSQGEERRLYLVRPDITIRYTADIDFLRLDPGLVSLMTGMPLAFNAAGDVVGFDAKTKLPARAFALEVWSKMAGSGCDGPRRWGYTLFPFLKGGVLSGFRFTNGLVSFSLTGAATQRNPAWGEGPYFLDLPSAVSRNTGWRQTLVPLPPPAQTDGITYLAVGDVDGGTATITSSDVLDGQFVVTSDLIVDGGAA